MEFEEFVKKKHWYASFWADVVWVSLGGLILLAIFGTQYATGEFGFAARIKKSSEIKKNEPIIVNFSQPVVASAVERNFEISPSVPVEFSWSDNYRRLEIKPANDFALDETYTFKINPQDKFSFSNLIGEKPEPVRLTFQTESSPKVASMTPLSGAQNIKIDSAIKINF